MPSNDLKGTSSSNARERKRKKDFFEGGRTFHEKTYIQGKREFP